MRRLGRAAAQAVLPALVLFGAWSWTEALVDREAAGPAERPTPAETVYSVTATDVALGDHRATLRAFGEVVAAEAAELRVASPGEVVDVHQDLAVGALVAAGAPLVTIDPFAYEGAVREAQAQLAEANARAAEARSRIALEENALERAREQLELAERDLARATDLRSGTIADRQVDDRRLLVSQRQQAVDQRTYSLEVERARLAQQEAQVDRLEWAVEKAERALADTVLTAPFEAIVRAENVAVGRILSANDVAAELVRADALEVRFTLSDERYGRLIADGLLIGTPVSMAWRIGDAPLLYEAIVERIGADVASDTGGVDVFARVAMPDGPVPRPGAFVEVAVPGRLHGGSARLPATALYGDAVFVIGEDDRLDRRPVTLLVRDGNEVIVRGPIADGEAVVTTRLAEVGEGLLVRRVELGGAVAVGSAAREPS
ncbi:efflux RND transporter periplasmic adaptor subunit [Acuticoccus sp.]|uniref:efflux RND transporter periplasmic adaptor subunit n=1 Tax=Acuticoccus sp. TaxID=1904378 RepID=UPI003B51674C